jgi:hypothetical protein
MHLTGHYYGVMPSAAEKALDVAISGQGNRSLIADHTRRRWLTGMLGQLNYFPARTPDDGSECAVVRAAVAGMGRVGTFTQTNATRLYESIIRELDALGYVQRAATVAIGAGAGNLSERQVAMAAIQGCRAALRGTPGAARHLKELVVVEFDRLRAEHLHRELLDASRRDGLVRVTDHITGSAGGRLGPDAAAVHAIRALLVQFSTPPDTSSGDDPTVRLLSCVSAELRDEVRVRLMEMAARPADVTAVTITAQPAQDGPERIPGDPRFDDPSTRITVMQSPSGLVWSALSARATVPEREVSVNATLLGSLVQRLTAPTAADAADLPPFLTRFLVPFDLQRHLTGDAPLVIEVDRATAVVPWEFLMPPQVSPDDVSEPLAVRQCLARQLRTSYARTDVEEPFAGRLSALVVGDTGAGVDALPAARSEAMAVASVLRERGISVDLFVGPPGGQPAGGARSGSRLDVLARLLTQHYDVVHYAGHGVFDPARPELSGWLFADGVLAARELAQMSTAPRLVIANACWSAARPGGTAGPGPGDSGKLAPVLADEFFRVGVGHFVGATWSVPDNEAQLFATYLYRHLLGSAQDGPLSVGQSVRVARAALWESGSGLRDGAAAERRTAWAAYQHYGDPSDHLLSGPADADALDGS